MLQVALKEWSVVCDLLVSGELAILLRKGGIHEYAGPGRFELEYRRFLLFPAWEHQRPELVKPAYQSRVQVFDREPAEITFRGWAEVAPETIWKVPSSGGRAAFDRLDDLHPWARAQIDMRFNYKPERPLYLMALRVHVLDRPKTVANRDAYAGCKSWVPLEPADGVDESASRPAMDDARFAALVERVRAALQSE